jgi:hypothetical protein
MSIKSIADIESDAQAAAISTANGTQVTNPYCAETHPAHANAWDAAYELAMHELGCFA